MAWRGLARHGKGAEWHKARPSGRASFLRVWYNIAVGRTNSEEGAEFGEGRVLAC